MTYPVLGQYEGIPAEYQHSTWVPDARYQGGGYYAGYSLGQHYTYAQLERLWLDAGGTMKEAPFMAYIAEYVESGGDAGDWNSSGATGLWQIEWPMNYGGNREDLFTPLVNAQTAVKMYNARGLQPWSGDKAKNLGIPPANTVPNERKAVPGGSTTATDTSFPGTGGGGSLIGGALLGPLGVLWKGGSGWQDTAERLGLIVFGGLLILIGIWMLAGKQITKVAVTAVAPEATAAGKVGKHAAHAQG